MRTTRAGNRPGWSSCGTALLIEVALADGGAGSTGGGINCSFPVELTTWSRYPASKPCFCEI